MSGSGQELKKAEALVFGLRASCLKLNLSRGFLLAWVAGFVLIIVYGVPGVWSGKCEEIPEAGMKYR